MSATHKFMINTKRLGLHTVHMCTAHSSSPNGHYANSNTCLGGDLMFVTALWEPKFQHCSRANSSWSYVHSAQT